MEHIEGTSQSNPSANRRDPRLYQIASLGTLLAYGLFWLHFDLSFWQIAVTIGTALLTQYAGTRYAKLPCFDPKSALISSLSLCILLRTDHLAIAALASVVAIGSKFVFRWQRQTPVQSDQPRVGRRARDRDGLDLAGTMGAGRLVRLPHRLPRQPRRDPRGAGGCDASPFLPSTSASSLHAPSGSAIR
jgi:hypothetical protein